MTKSDAQDWLDLTRADTERNHRRAPDAGAVNFEKYALRGMEERGLAPATVRPLRRPAAPGVRPGRS